MKINMSLPMELELINPPTVKPRNTVSSRKRLPLIAKVGYTLLCISLLTYAACEYAGVKTNLFMIFFLHYFIGVAYTFFLILNGSFGIRRSWNKENIGKSVIAVNLYLISAYALNREVQVFANSTDWFCVYLLITSATLLSFQYFKSLPSWVNKLQYLLLGFAIILYVYMSLYVANFYAIGAIGIIAIGIGLHILVPATLLTTAIFVFRHNHRGTQPYYWTAAGLVAPVMFAVVFMVEWNSRIAKIETFVNQSVIYEQNGLPAWLNVAQYMENDWISERILKSDLVYTTSNEKFSDWEFMPRIVSWDEVKKHDPLVFLSSMVRKCSLSDEDRVSILKAIARGRHQANERLWSGDNLSTAYIVSDIDIYPALRLAYTEKYVNVRNNGDKGRWWGNTQEGIYTFYLPEGSVVTSLSLWIEGKEEKGILTSKQKAANAYTTIVGVERRDPSVVHWQEGNTVTVRVFPCTSEEERKFKIGITTPLRTENGRTFYSNIIFDGPTADRARETTRVRFIGGMGDLDLPGNFEKDRKGDYVSDRRYDPDFKLSFKTVPVTTNQFTFDGFVYSTAEYNPAYAPFMCNNIFLDINNSWTSEELSELKSLMNKHSLYVYDDSDPIKLDSRNWDELTDEMLERNFSLFPFHKIADPLHALVITKGIALSPHLSDFNDSQFAEDVKHFFTAGKKINVYNLEGSTSTYISSFREFRGLEFASGSALQLKDLLSQMRFIKSDESDEKIILHDSKMVVTKVSSQGNALSDNAPDHLARLYAYNDIMRKAGPAFLNRKYVDEALVNEASSAYVVSPVSSLIVLETQEDYERFNIHDSQNSLHNAAKKSSGAVPEPHEWALIILFALFILYKRFRFF